MTARRVSFDNWAQFAGAWELSGTSARYLSPPPRGVMGVLLSPEDWHGGRVEVTATVEATPDRQQIPSDFADAGLDLSLPQLRLIAGRDPETMELFAAGLGGHNGLYVAEEFDSQRGGWSPLRALGDYSRLEIDRPYRLALSIHGQRAMLEVDDVEITALTLPRPLAGRQLGLVAWGTSPIRFEDFTVTTQQPTAFVVMQFGEPYDTLFTEVLKPVMEGVGLNAIRATDVYGPGVILDDIIDSILESAVVVADISPDPANANVFYEIGFSHAVEKPTILLANRGRSLPFDIRSFRVVFYDDTIGGKPVIERELERHLTAALGTI